MRAWPEVPAPMQAVKDEAAIEAYERQVLAFLAEVDQEEAEVRKLQERALVA